MNRNNILAVKQSSSEQRLNQSTWTEVEPLQRARPRNDLSQRRGISGYIGPPTRTVDFKLLSFWKKKKVPKAQPEPVLRSILRTPGSQSFRSLCYKVTFAHLDTVQTRTEYLGPEDWYNYRLNRFTSNLQELKRKQYSKNPNELLHICKESADIIRIELPEYLNCFWTSLLDVPQKFETLKKGQHCIKHLEDEINLQIQESKKMSGSDKSHQTPPQLSQQPLQPSNVLETPKSNPSVDPELNSSTMMYGDENPNELQRIEDERKKQQK